ncbi:MAG: Crp/Fnr family transcriptional regulator [Cyanobacteria bacterium P01_F01_bin.150]
MVQPIESRQLHDIPLFADLEPAILEQLAQDSWLTPYATDNAVFYEGDRLPACLHIIVSGRLCISKIAPSGKETILRILSAGEIFAAPAIFGNGIAPATAKAIESTTVLTIKKQTLLDSFAKTPELALHLLGILNQRLQQLHKQVHGLASERAIVRLVHYLEYVVQQSGTIPVETGEQLRSPHTYYQIARSIGITYEECVRLFKRLHPAVVYRRGGIITICDRQHLNSFRE